MYTESDGIVLRQVKILNGRRMVSILTRKFGKISAGSNLSERSRGKSALAIRPFTYGKYEFFKTRDQYSLNAAETMRSFYRIGEDVDKYLAAAYVLEYSDKISEEGLPNSDIFKLLYDFLDLMEKREKKHGTPVCAYMLKSFEYLGVGVDWDALSDGEEAAAMYDKEGLIFTANSDIVGAMRYMAEKSIKSLENIALDDDRFRRIMRFCENYAAVHLEIGELKSKEFLV